MPVPRILVIDDEEQVRSVLRSALEKKGYEVDEAADGWEGTRVFLQRREDLVIVDLFMPRKDGVETIIEIRQIQPDVIAIAISGGGLTAALEFLTHAQTFGAACTFEKPIDMDEFLKTVRKLIGPATSNA